MTNEQSAKYNAYQAIKTFLAAHDAEMQVVPAYASAAPAFTAKLQALEQAIQQQDTDTAGPTAAKAAARLAVVAAVMPIVAGVGAHGQATGNNTLEEAVKVNETDLAVVLGDDAFSGRVNRILDAATTAIANLLPYTINGATINSARALLATWSTHQGKVRHAIAEGVKGTKAIKRIMADIDEFLEDTLDRLVVIATVSNPGMADEYAAVREIDDSPTQTRALTVTVSATEGGQTGPVPGATATINPGGLQKTTGAEGGFYVQNLAAGSYTIALSKPGYLPVTAQPFVVADGEMTTLALTMVVDTNNQ